MSFMKNMSNPGNLIKGAVLLVVALGVLAGVLPSIITYLINISSIDNLAFADFFAANGIALIAVSAAVVLGIFGVLGLTGSKR